MANEWAMFVCSASPEEHEEEGMQGDTVQPTQCSRDTNQLCSNYRVYAIGSPMSARYTGEGSQLCTLLLNSVGHMMLI